MMQPMSLPKSTGHLLPAFHQTLDRSAHTPQRGTQQALASNSSGRSTIFAPALPPQQNRSYQHIIRENLELRERMALLEQCATKSWSSRRKSTQVSEKRKRRVSKLPLIRLPPRTLAPLAGKEVNLPEKSTESETNQLMVSGAAVETYQRVGKDTSRRPMMRRTNTKPTISRLSVTPSVEAGAASKARQTSIEDDASMTDDRSLSSMLRLSIELPPITEIHFSDDGGSSIGYSYTDNTEPPPFEIPRKKALPRADDPSTARDGLDEPPPDALGNCPPFTMLTWVPWPTPASTSEAVSSTNDTSVGKQSPIKPTSRARSRRRLFSAGPLDRTFLQPARSFDPEQASQGHTFIPLAESAMSKPIRLPSLIGLPLASPILHSERARRSTESEGSVAQPVAQVNMPHRSLLPEGTPPDVPDIPRRSAHNYRKVTLGGRRKLFARKQGAGDMDNNGMDRDQQSCDTAASSVQLTSCSEDTMEVDLEGVTREKSTS
jgi:hypothetical protein